MSCCRARHTPSGLPWMRSDEGLWGALRSGRMIWVWVWCMTLRKWAPFCPSRKRCCWEVTSSWLLTIPPVTSDPSSRSIRMQVAFCKTTMCTHNMISNRDVECVWTLIWIKCLSSLFDTDLDSSCIALQAPDSAAALVEGGLCLGMRWQSPEAHTDPQSLHYLLDEWGACIWKSLGHQADWEVKSQG